MDTDPLSTGMVLPCSPGAALLHQAASAECASGLTWPVRLFSGIFRLRVTGYQFFLVTKPSHYNNWKLSVAITSVCSEREKRGLPAAGMENEGLNGFSWFTHPWFQMPLMPTCITTPLPGELLDSYLDSVRCFKVPAVSPHFCSSLYELSFCYLQAKGQGHAPRLLGPLHLFIFTHRCSHPTLSYIP